jgi:hypothetical protein
LFTSHARPVAFHCAIGVTEHRDRPSGAAALVI